MVSIIPVSRDYEAELFDAVRESLCDLAPWMAWATASYSIEDARYWLENLAPQGHEFFVFNASGTYVGNVGLNGLRPDNKIANLGYWIRSTVRGQGLAVEAVNELVSWARSNTDLNRLEVVVALGNEPSRRVAEKAGAHYEGVARARLLLNGKFHDAAMYSFTIGAAGT